MEHDRCCHGLRTLTCHAGHHQHQCDVPHDVSQRTQTFAAPVTLDRWMMCKGLAADLDSKGQCAQNLKLS
jgi:hypothetical protein